MVTAPRREFIMQTTVFKIIDGMVNCVHITPERKCRSNWLQIVNLQCMFKGKEYIINDKVLSKLFFKFFLC